MNAESPYDAVLEDNVTGYGDEATTDRATEYGILLAQAPSGKKSEKKAEPKLTATKLLITDPSDANWQQYTDAYAKYVLKGAEKRNVNSWEELSVELHKYQSIEQVVLYFHGTPGSLIIGGDPRDLDKVSNLFLAPNPKIKQIDLDACSVGEAPDKLVPFARIFGASTITAWTYFHVGKPEKFDVPRGDVDLSVLRTKYADHKDYFLPGTPTFDEMARNPSTYNLGVEWFRIDLRDDPLPPAPGPGGLDQRGKTFKRRSDAKPRRINSDKAKELRELYKSKGPDVPFEQVIITITG
jgi:hypothetical protein